MLNEETLSLGATRSDICDLFEYGTARANLVGKENVLDFSIGNPSIPTPKEVDDTLRDLLTHTDSLLLHGYTSSEGDYATRKAIADDLNSRFPMGAKPEDFFLTCGAAPALATVFRALAVKNGEILAIAPYFSEYRPFAQGAGLKFGVVPADIPNFQIDFAALEKMLTPHTVALILNAPNNPAGTVYTAETLTKLAKLLTEKSAQFGHPIYIVSDEPYRELYYSADPFPFPANFYKDTIVTYSYAKSLSLPGERIGYIFVPESATDARDIYASVCGAARQLGHVCAPSLMQKLIARCPHLRPNLTAYEKNRAALYQGLIAAGYEVAKPDGAFYLFAKAPGLTGKQVSEKAKALDVMVVPGDSFGCPDYFRMCYCVSYETIQKALPLMAKLLEK